MPICGCIAQRVNMVADISIQVEFEADQHWSGDDWEDPNDIMESYLVDGLKTFLKDHAPTALYNGTFRVTIVSCEPTEGTSS